jgi:hypothetical protein
MKAFILSSLFILSILCCKAQNSQVSSLPSGKYETIEKSNQNKWERGDIILIDQNKYRISTSDEIGEYKFSITAQRIFFISGPLKSLYARTSLNNDTPAIVLPVSENQGLKISSDVWGYYRQ